MSDMDLQRVTESMSYIGQPSNRSFPISIPLPVFAQPNSFGRRDPITQRIPVSVESIAACDALACPVPVCLHYDPIQRPVNATRLRTGYDARAPGSNRPHRVKDGSLRTMRKQWRGNQVDQVISADVPERRMICGRRKSWHSSIASVRFNGW